MPSRDDKTVLVTGASGFVGAHLALYLAQSSYRVVALGGASPCSAEVSALAAESHSLDLRNSAAVNALIGKVKPEIIIHAAALAQAALCQRDPGLARESNVGATSYLLEAAKKQGAIFLYLSTDLVFDGGDAPAGGFRETDPVQPLSVYAQTKAEAEQLVLASGLRACVLRSCLVYGKAIGGKGGFLSWLCEELKNGRPVKLFTDEWRTAVAVEDLAHAVQRIIELLGCEQNQEHSQACAERILHVGGAERLSRYEFGLILAVLLGVDPKLVHAVRQADLTLTVPRPRDVSLNSERLCSLLARPGLHVVDELAKILAPASE